MSRFERTADQMAQHQEERAAALAEAIRSFVQPDGGEHALDVGTGAGALALALAPLVRDVVGVDVEPALLERARALAPENATFVEGDATALPFPDAAFDLTGTLRTLHHVHRPELAVAELARVTRPQGRILVVDQLAPLDPLEALALDRFERARADDHERLLSDQDLRSIFDVNRLGLIREHRVTEVRQVGECLDLAGCEGDERARAAALAPHGPDTLTVEIGWYLLKRL
jgi:ubiquinone/menaquinone biosynthesis C-methylase UbiE